MSKGKEISKHLDQINADMLTSMILKKPFKNPNKN
jgi:hypothetical protein